MKQYRMKNSENVLNHFTDFLISKPFIEFIIYLTLFFYKVVGGFVERLVRKYNI